MSSGDAKRGPLKVVVQKMANPRAGSRKWVIILLNSECSPLKNKENSQKTMFFDESAFWN